MDKTDMKPKDGAIRSGQITQDLTSCVKEVKVRWEAVKGSEPEKGHIGFVSLKDHLLLKPLTSLNPHCSQ